MKTIKTLLFAATALALGTAAASAHVTLETQEAQVPSTYKAVFRVGHGCEGKPTIKIRVQIPEGVIAVKPQPKPGWTIEKVKGPYAKSYDYYGTPTSEGVKEIVWSGGSLGALFPGRAGMPGWRGRALDRDPRCRQGCRRLRDARPGREARPEEVVARHYGARRSRRAPFPGRR